MKTVREKFLTVAEAEKATGVHYTVKILSIKSYPGSA